MEQSNIQYNVFQLFHDSFTDPLPTLALPFEIKENLSTPKTTPLDVIDCVKSVLYFVRRIAELPGFCHQEHHLLE